MIEAKKLVSFPFFFLFQSSPRCRAELFGRFTRRAYCSERVKTLSGDPCTMRVFFKSVLLDQDANYATSCGRTIMCVHMLRTTPEFLLNQ